MRLLAELQADSSRHAAHNMQRQLRVAWLHDTAQRTGGCETYMMETAARLRDEGVRSALLYGQIDQGPRDMLTAFDEAFPIVRLQEQLETMRPDVIYAHRLPDEATVKVLLQSGIPTLRFFHDHKLFCPREHKYTTLGHQTCTKTIGLNCYKCLGFVNRSESFPGIRLQTVGSLKRAQQAQHAFDGFVVASQYMKQHLGDHGFAAERTHVLPLYTELPELSKAEPNADAPLLFVGQVVRGKGLDLLIQALAKVPNAPRLVVAGDGKQLPECQQMVTSLNLENRVTFVGKQSLAEVQALYQTASCLVAPSRSPETFCQVGIEAMAAGLPVIAADVGGIGEWLNHGVNGWAFRTNDVASLADALRTAFDPNTNLVEVRQAARNTVAEKFLPAQHIQALHRLFHQVAKVAS